MSRNPTPATETSVVVTPKMFDMVDMTVSKKELIGNLIEIQEVSMQETIEQTRDQINELSDFSDVVTKQVTAQIQKEIKNNRVIKAHIASQAALASITHENESNTRKAFCVDANYRNGDVNVAAVYNERFGSMYFGTSNKRAQSGTIDLNKVSATAKKLHAQMVKRLDEIGDAQELLKKQERALANFRRNSAKVKHNFNKTILNQTPEGRKILAQLDQYEKDFKKMK